MKLRAACLAALVAMTSGCSSGSSSDAASGLASGSVGDLRISNGYIPAEASPDVAVAYFTVRDVGSQPDVLMSASTPAAQAAQFHSEGTLPSGAEVMTSLGPVEIPAKGSISFTVGHMHLMLVQPAHLLIRGEHVPITLRFKEAGSVTLDFPVTAAVGPGDMGGMKGMPGMAG